MRAAIRALGCSFAVLSVVSSRLCVALCAVVALLQQFSGLLYCGRDVCCCMRRVSPCTPAPASPRPALCGEGLGFGPLGSRRKVCARGGVCGGLFVPAVETCSLRNCSVFGRLTHDGRSWTGQHRLLRFELKTVHRWSSRPAEQRSRAASARLRQRRHQSSCTAFLLAIEFSCRQQP